MGLGVPYAAALGVFVALMDMVPVVGSTIGGVVVSLVALAVSFPVAAGIGIVTSYDSDTMPVFPQVRGLMGWCPR
ncbi:hypothetical protein AB0C81_17925 [Streptomyces roseoverticillatus]|uniref:hypothetical protein n=1 Tax=Streptomyces roseoverticillatus TaxID=66429 RepID=UPI0033F688B9